MASMLGLVPIAVAMFCRTDLSRMGSRAARVRWPERSPWLS
jgi:hypothetical protein